LKKVILEFFWILIFREKKTKVLERIFKKLDLSGRLRENKVDI